MNRRLATTITVSCETHPYRRYHVTPEKRPFTGSVPVVSRLLHFSFISPPTSTTLCLVRDGKLINRDELVRESTAANITYCTTLCLPATYYCS